MTDDELTRRNFIRAVGGVGIAAGPLARSDGTDSTTDLAASDLVVSGELLPPEFEPVGVPDEPPFIERLTDADDQFEDADAAVRGYYVGGDQQHAERIVSTLAIVCDTAPPRDVVESVSRSCHEQLLDEYRTERSDVTGHMKERHTDEWSEWRIALSLDRPPYVHKPEFTATEFLDLVRIQQYGRVVLGTVSFGPMDGTLRTDRLLWRGARKQRDKLAAVRTS